MKNCAKGPNSLTFTIGGGGFAGPIDRLDYMQFSDKEIQAIVTVVNNANTQVKSYAYTPDPLFIKEPMQKAIAALQGTLKVIRSKFNSEYLAGLVE